MPEVPETTSRSFQVNWQAMVAMILGVGSVIYAAGQETQAIRDLIVAEAVNRARADILLCKQVANIEVQHHEILQRNGIAEKPGDSVSPQDCDRLAN